VLSPCVHGCLSFPHDHCADDCCSVGWIHDDDCPAGWFYDDDCCSGDWLHDDDCAVGWFHYDDNCAVDWFYDDRSSASSNRSGFQPPPALACVRLPARREWDGHVRDSSTLTTERPSSVHRPTVQWLRTH
jgi:hypothetical protein